MSNWIVFRDNSDEMSVFSEMSDKLTAEKCVEDASEYIWLRWEARNDW